MTTRKHWSNPIAVICTALFFQALPCSGKTVFMIGNSFTLNSMPYSIPAIAAQKSDSSQMCEIVNKTVWDVVSKNPSTGVAGAADSKNAAGGKK